MMKAQHSGGVDVLFVLPHLGPGGAQKVVSVVTGHLIREGRTVAVLTLIPKRARHDLPDEAKRVMPQAILRFGAPAVQFARTTALRMLPPHLRTALAARRTQRLGMGKSPEDLVALPWTDRLRRRLIASTVRRLRPTVVMSLLTKTNVLTLLATSGTGTRVIISERNRLIQRQEPHVHRLRAKLYPSHQLVTANASTIVEELRDDLGVHHACLLPNVIQPALIRDAGSPRENIVLVVARLVPQKRVDLALAAFSTLHELVPTWTLQIVGDGPEAAHLQRLAAEIIPRQAYGFLGHLDDPRPVISRSRILIHPSAFEGTSNALLEAMACGVVPLASDESDPASELVVEGLTGRRFGGDHQPITAQLIRLATRDDLPLLAMRAQETANRFTWVHQREAWHELLFGGPSAPTPAGQ